MSESEQAPPIDTAYELVNHGAWGNKETLEWARGVAERLDAERDIADGILCGAANEMLNQAQWFSDQKEEMVANQEWHAASAFRDAQDRTRAMHAAIAVTAAIARERFANRGPRTTYGAVCGWCDFTVERMTDKEAVMEIARQHDRTCQNNPMLALLGECRTHFAADKVWKVGPYMVGKIDAILSPTQHTNDVPEQDTPST